MEAFLEFADLLHRDVVEETAGAGEQDRNLLLDLHGRVLVLLQQLGHPLTLLELRQRLLVEVGAEGRERGQLAVLGEVKAEAAGDLAHGLDLGCATDPGHRGTGVDGGADAGVEKIGIDEDLTVGDRDDVGGDVPRDVALEGFDDRQGGQRAAAVLVVHLGGALQQAAVEIEDVTRVSLAARRAAKQQGDLPVGPSVLGEVVVDHQGLAAAIPEVLAHGATGEGGQEPERRRLGAGGSHDDGVVHRPVLLEGGGEAGDGLRVLPDADVDADQVLALLVDDGVDGDRRLTSLAVPDDQLALAAADRHHRVDGLEAGLHRRIDRLTGDHAGRHQLHRLALLGVDGALAVDWLTKSVDDPTDEGLAHRDLGDAARGADLVALFDLVVGAHDDDADGVLLQVQGQARDATGELHDLTRLHAGEPVNVGDAVADVGDDADIFAEDRDVKFLDLLLQQLGDFLALDSHLVSCRLSLLPVPGAFPGGDGGRCRR